MLHRLLKRAQVAGTPLIDGDKATFVWHGHTAPCLLGDFNHWNPREPIELRRAAPEVWTHSIKFLRDAYIEYAFVRDGEHVADRFNPRTTPNGYGGFNHYFYMSGGPTPLIERRRHVPRGLVTRHVIESDLVFGGRRAVYFYQPPIDRPCPLIVVFDGRDYLRRARLPHIVDNLVAEGRMQPVALALIDHAGSARIQEYSASEAIIGFVLTRVLPLARSQLNLTEPGNYGVLGASLGGLSSLVLGLRYPKIFNRILSQSASVILRGHETVVFDLVRARFNPQAKIWLDVGRYELLKSANRHFRDWLATMNYDATLREYHAGHNYAAWRDDVWRGLEELFG